MHAHMIDGHPVVEVNGVILHIRGRDAWSYKSTTGVVTLFKDDMGLFGFAHQGNGPLPFVDLRRWWTLNEAVVSARIDFPVAPEGIADPWAHDSDRTTRQETWR